MMRSRFQVNGKVKARISVSVDGAKDAVLAAAKAEPRIAELLEGKNLIKEIFVPGRMVNLVVK